MQLKFFWAVTNYGIDAVEPDFTGMELAIWIPMRDLIKNSKAKREAWLEKQKKNGKKGGAPAGNHNARKTTQTSLNVNDNGNGNENEQSNLQGFPKNPDPQPEPPNDKTFPTAIAVTPETSADIVSSP
jgi:hypothetical protein